MLFKKVFEPDLISSNNAFKLLENPIAMTLQKTIYAVEFTEENLEKIIKGLFSDTDIEILEKYRNENKCSWAEALKKNPFTALLRAFDPIIEIRSLWDQPFKPFGTGFCIDGHPSSEIYVLMPQARSYVEGFYTSKSINYKIVQNSD